MTRIAFWITGILAFVVGAVFGIAGTIGHVAMWGPIPIGLLVASIGVAALLVALRLLTGVRWTVLAAGMGVMVATLVLSGKGPGGSVVVPAPAEGELSLGIVWTIVVPVITAIVVAWPQVRTPASAPARAAAPRVDVDAQR